MKTKLGESCPLGGQATSVLGPTAEKLEMLEKELRHQCEAWQHGGTRGRDGYFDQHRLTHFRLSAT
jgi:hypothetical protein